MLSSRVVEEGDVTEEDEDDEDGIRFATLESPFENKETVFNWWTLNLSCLQCKKMVKALQIVPISTLSRRMANKICYIFWVWIIIKAVLRQISPNLLSHSRIRIIMLTCPGNINVIFLVCKKSSAKLIRVCKITQIINDNVRPLLFPLKYSLPFSLSLSLWRL